MKKLLKSICILGCSLLTLTLSSCNERIDAANIGLLVRQYGSEKGQPVTIASGRVWYNPWSEDVIQIPAYVQHKEFEKVTVSSSDGSLLDMTPSLNYRVDKGRVIGIYLKYRRELPELEEQVIKTIIRESYRIVLNSFTMDSIMSSRAKIERMALDTLSKKLEKEGFIVEQLTSGLTPPESITASVNAKNKAVQDAIKIENEVRQTEAEAKKKVAESRGWAESKRIEADAEAYSYKTKQQNLTPLLIQQEWIEKWDGKLPVYGQVPSLMKSVQ